MRAASPIVLLFVTGAAVAQITPDVARGQRLYETHCGGCHYERLHERPRERSIVHSRAELRREVAARAALTGRPFTPDDLDDIAEYLNRSHYRFDR